MSETNDDIDNELIEAMKKVYLEMLKNTIETDLVVTIEFNESLWELVI